ncbi:MAG: DUF2089 domain-containing protein [Chloroflexi bacterium]|nr:DUF2089 domain-containing protein [Chloroflexota bacterium]
MNEEKMMILKMLQEGKISADEAAKLLESLDTGVNKEGKTSDADTSQKSQGKFFRVLITDTDTGKARANIRIPLSVLGIGVKFGAQFAPQIGGVEQEQIMEAIHNGQVGKILDVFDDEDGEHVEIFIE